MLWVTGRLNINNIIKIFNWNTCPAKPSSAQPAFNPPAGWSIDPFRGGVKDWPIQLQNDSLLVQLYSLELKHLYNSSYITVRVKLPIHFICGIVLLVSVPRHQDKWVLHLSTSSPVLTANCVASIIQLLLVWQRHTQYIKPCLHFL